MAKMTAPTGAKKEETPQERALWRAFRQYVKEINPRKDTTFEVQGYVKSLTGDPENPGMPKFMEGKGEIKARYVLDAICVTTDPRFPGLEFKKTLGFSFFNGMLRGGGTGRKGGMYTLHYAVTGEEPSQALQSGKGEFDPEEDYTGEKHPIMLRLIYRGKVEEDSEYYGRRGNLTIFLDGFEPMDDKVASDFDDDDDAEPVAAVAKPTDAESDPWDED